MPNTIKELKKIASAIPILGAPFVNENKTKRFVTDTSKFIFGILMMSLVKFSNAVVNRLHQRIRRETCAVLLGFVIGLVRNGLVAW